MELTTTEPELQTRQPLFETSIAEFAEWCRQQGQPAYRARQIRDWIVRMRATSFDAMTNVPIRFRQELDRHWEIFGTRVRVDRCDADATHKLLLGLHDGQTVECVLLAEEDRRTVCLSTQVGCGMGCVFCASGLNGVVRNLSAGEMIEELLQLRHLLPVEERITHIVVMGMGEPLANLDNLLIALEFATSKDGLGLSARHVTISTVGLPAKIRKLADAGKAYHLAVSLHAPNDALRRQIVPMAEKVALSDILDAADAFHATTGRQVTFEYVLLGGINDGVEHARELAQLLAGREAFVNLIPYNPVEGLPYVTPAPERTQAFASVLRAARCTVRIRKRKGAKIDAACGQLRREMEPLVSLA